MKWVLMERQYDKKKCNSMLDSKFSDFGGFSEGQLVLILWLPV